MQNIINLCARIEAGYEQGKSGMDDGMIDRVLELSNHAKAIGEALQELTVARLLIADLCGENKYDRSNAWSMNKKRWDLARLHSADALSTVQREVVEAVLKPGVAASPAFSEVVELLKAALGKSDAGAETPEQARSWTDKRMAAIRAKLAEAAEPPPVAPATAFCAGL